MPSRCWRYKAILEEQRKGADLKEHGAKAEQLDLSCEVDDDDLREISMQLVVAFISDISEMRQDCLQAEQTNWSESPVRFSSNRPPPRYTSWKFNVMSKKSQPFDAILI